jgi:hypothetical protein
MLIPNEMPSDLTLIGSAWSEARNTNYPMRVQGIYSADE